MAYSKCSATFCGYNKHNIKRRKLHVMFHKFPGDSELCRKWIRFCRQHENWQPKPTSALCSTHFREQDYQMVNSPLVKASGFRKLKIDAVPTIVKGVAIPIAKRLKLDEQRRKDLMKMLYNEDVTTTEHEDNSTEVEFDQGKKGSPISDSPIDRLQNKPANNHKATAYDKIVYRLHKFPNVCAFCFKTIEDESLFFSVSFYHVKLQCTIEEKFDAITGGANDNEDRAEVRHLLPDKICNECLDALVHFHQFQKQLECMRKFSTGMAKLFKGSRAILEDLYLEEGAHLIKVLKKLNLCQGSDDKITVERLALEVATYGRVTKFTKFEYDPSKVKVPEQTEVPETMLLSDDEDVAGHDENTSTDEDLSFIITSSTPKPQKRQLKDEVEYARPRKHQMVKREHRNLKRWVCPYADICNNYYLDESALQQHVRVSHKTFKCKTCGYSMEFYDLYKKHVESHAIARALLISHNKTTSTEFLKCDSCGKTFLCKELFERHKKTHLVERNYVCGTCLEAYFDEKAFENHKCFVKNKIEKQPDHTLVEHLYAKPISAEYETEIEAIDDRISQHSSSFMSQDDIFTEYLSSNSDHEENIEILQLEEIEGIIE